MKSNSYRGILRDDDDDDDNDDDIDDEDAQPYPKRRKTLTMAQAVQKKVHLFSTFQKPFWKSQF